MDLKMYCMTRIMLNKLKNEKSDAAPKLLMNVAVLHQNYSIMELIANNVSLTTYVSNLSKFLFG